MTDGNTDISDNLNSVLDYCHKCPTVHFSLHSLSCMAFVVYTKLAVQTLFNIFDISMPLGLLFNQEVQDRSYQMSTTA